MKRFIAFDCNYDLHWVNIDGINLFGKYINKPLFYGMDLYGNHITDRKKYENLLSRGMIIL